MTHYTAWPVKIAYFLLVLWVAVISPLIYFGDYSAHKGVRGFQLNIWQSSTQAAKLNQALTEIAAQTQPEQPTARYLRDVATISAANRVMTATGQKLTRYQDYLVNTVAVTIFIFSVLGQLVLAHLSGGQIELPPPKHPPSLLLGF